VASLMPPSASVMVSVMMSEVSMPPSWGEGKYKCHFSLICYMPFPKARQPRRIRDNTGACPWTKLYSKLQHCLHNGTNSPMLDSVVSNNHCLQVPPSASEMVSVAWGEGKYSGHETLVRHMLFP